jgi:hypothetical protein
MLQIKKSHFRSGFTRAIPTRFSYAGQVSYARIQSSNGRRSRIIKTQCISVHHYLDGERVEGAKTKSLAENLILSWASKKLLLELGVVSNSSNSCTASWAVHQETCERINCCCFLECAIKNRLSWKKISSWWKLRCVVQWCIWWVQKLLQTTNKTEKSSSH